MNFIVQNVISKIQRIRKESNGPFDSVAIHKWLADDVAPLVIQFAADHRFELAANWPLDNLVDGANSQLRFKIQQVNDDLIGLISKLGAFLPNCSTDSTNQSVATCEFVDPKEYWKRSDRFSKPDTRLYGIECLGDRITRSFLARLELTINELEKQLLRQPVDAHVVVKRGDTAKLERVKAKSKAIARDCRKQLNGFVEASIILTQVYAEFARYVDLHWLPKDYAPEPGEHLWRNSTLDPHVELDVIDRVVWALSIVSRSLEELPDPESVIEEATLRYRLVVDLSAKTIAWQGEQLNRDLSPTSWELFSLLVEARKFWNRPVEPLDLDRRNGSFNKLKVQKQRLANSLHDQFPKLAEAIDSSEKSYTLAIDRNQIVVFSRRTTERIYRLCGVAETTPVSTDVH